MIDVLAGVLMVSGSSMMLGSTLYLTISAGPNAAELVAALPFTPVPRPDAALEQLLASID